eukprot:scaffold80356_cov60-Phaeocystis_antarctica.AAC.3
MRMCRSVSAKLAAGVRTQLGRPAPRGPSYQPPAWHAAPTPPSPHLVVSTSLYGIHGGDETLGHVLGLQLLRCHDLADRIRLLDCVGLRAHDPAARVVARLDKKADAAVGLPDHGAGRHAGELADVRRHSQFPLRLVIRDFNRLIKEIGQLDGNMACFAGKRDLRGWPVYPDERLRPLVGRWPVLTPSSFQQRTPSLVVRVLHPELHLVHRAVR